MTLLHDLHNEFQSSFKKNLLPNLKSSSFIDREKIYNQLNSFDLEELRHLIKNTHNEASPARFDPRSVHPPQIIALPQNKLNDPQWVQAKTLGLEAIKNKEVGIITVAGGQGTRLGISVPKGTFPVTPVLNRTLFQVFADKINFYQNQFQIHIPWFILTSPINHQDICSYFESHNYFNLKHIYFFQQKLLPCIDFSGKVILSAKDEIAVAPNGHGGIFEAIKDAHLFPVFKDLNIKTLSYHQVDNPLANILDPYFIGFYKLNHSEFASKTVPKISPDEKVGLFCNIHGKIHVLEYSHISEELIHAKDSQGNLKLNASNLAIHLIDVNFVKKIACSSPLPYHCAKKMLKTIDDSEHPIYPNVPNGIKFEKFVFDAIPLANNPILLETSRFSEFSPIKNATGTDSLNTSQKDQLRLWSSWLNAVNERICFDDENLPNFKFEIRPVFADNQEDFISRWTSLSEKPIIQEGTILQ